MKIFKLFIYLFPFFFVTAQASQQEFNKNTELNLEKEDLALQQGIEKYLPQFFENNKTMVEKIQRGKHQAVVVIGNTGAGKSTLIGGLLGHKFIVEEQKIHTVKNGRKRTRKKKMLVNKNPHNAPKIGYNPVNPETIFTETYLDKETNLAFIDTAGLGDVRKDGKAINLCNALGLHSLIEAIGCVKCIIGVIEYGLFKAGKGSNTFVNLLTVTSGLLKNTSPETLTSSMVLAFTKVPSNITKQDINEALEDQCDGLDEKKKKKQMTEEDKVAEMMYKILFPSCYGLENEKNVPFFLISEESILQQGLVRQNMLLTLQNATQVDSKDIGLVIEPNLLQKTRDWVAKRAQIVARHIRSKQHLEKKITSINNNLLSNRQELLKQEKLLKDLTDPNNQAKQEIFIKYLKENIQNNNERIKELNLEIKNNKKEKKEKKEKIQSLNTNEVCLSEKIVNYFDNNTEQYHYTYNKKNVPIDYITYGKDSNEKQNSNNSTKKYHIKNPKSGDSVSHNYKVVKITKNYEKGILYITLVNTTSLIDWGIAGIFGMIGTMPSFLLGATLTFLNLLHPDDFYIYAKKKYVYHNDINTLSKDIDNLEEGNVKAENSKKRLIKESQLITYQLQRLQSNNLTKDQLQNNRFVSEKLKQAISRSLLREKQMAEQTEQQIKIKKEEIKKIENDLQNFQSLLTLLNDKIKQNDIIPYIITQVVPFIQFHDKCKLDFGTCIQYMNGLKQNNQHDNTNKKHIDYQPGRELEQKENDDCDYNNNNNSSSLSSSLLLGTTTVVSSSLLKKKN